MAVTITATAKGSSSNSYGTLAEANTYHEARVGGAGWTGYGEDDRNRALVTAARRLDQEEWAGLKSDAGQALQWPRDGLYDEDGDSVGSDTIPDRIKYAQFELALGMLKEDLLADTGLEGFDGVAVGALDVKPRTGYTAGTLPAHVRRFVRWWLTTSRSTVRLERG